MSMIGARQFISMVADTGTFERWDDAVIDDDPLEFVDTRPYRSRLAEAKRRTGEDEAVLTGVASVAGNRTALVVCEFGFLGGSMGVVAGERIARAFERAGTLGIPLVGVVASGGVRMQEGVPAFLQMVKTADAAQRFRQAGGGFVVYLSGPAMGGMVASWAGLAQVTLAAPGALIGLSGPRVVEATTGISMPADAQRAEQLFAAGRIDELVAPGELRGRLEEILAFFSATAVKGCASDEVSGRPGDLFRVSPLPMQQRDPWLAVEDSRNAMRPGAAEFLATAGPVVCVLRGDGAGGAEDSSCLACLCWFDGIRVVAVAQMRRGHTRASLGPAGYRKARRAIALAAELKLPLLTVVDTCGAEASVAAEHGGLASEIACCLADLVAVRVPTLSVLLGEGSGGGALALLPADLVVAAEHAWLAPLAPEGSSALLFRTADRAPQMARLQRIAAMDLFAQGAVDVVVPEGQDAAEEPDGLLTGLTTTVASALRTLLAASPAERLERRWLRYRNVGIRSDAAYLPQVEGGQGVSADSGRYRNSYAEPTRVASDG